MGTLRPQQLGEFRGGSLGLPDRPKGLRGCGQLGCHLRRGQRRSALGKPTFLFRNDFRRATDSSEYPLNLMLFTGMPQEGWRDYDYTTLDEFTAPEKALARWAREQ